MRVVRRLRQVLRRMRRVRPAILMYHRVATVSSDPWDLAVTPERFAEQVAYLSRSRRPMTMSAFVAAIHDGTLAHNAVAITFDDGYRDNLLAAAPVLAAARVPATLFATTGLIADPRPFWWDSLARLILENPRAVHSVVAVNGVDVELSWEAGVDADDWRGWQPVRTGRQRAYHTIWSTLRDRPDEERRDCIDRIGALLGHVDMALDRSMNGTELQSLADMGVFELGAHSVSHAALTTLSASDRLYEITQSRSDCERLTGTRVAGFAYPFGDVDERVRADVVASGFAWACSTDGGGIDRARVDVFRLPRVAIGNWSVSQFSRALHDA